MSDPIDDYIRAHHEEHTREALTQQMLAAGHDRAAIEAGWSRLDQSPRWTAQAPQRSNVNALALIVIVGALVLGGVLFAQKGTPDRESNGGVPWGDYDSSVKTRIDGLAAEKDCAGLQTEFDTADANNAATRTRTGHSNAELMDYIDTRMRRAGCYS